MAEEKIHARHSFAAENLERLNGYFFDLLHEGFRKRGGNQKLSALLIDVFGVIRIKFMAGNNFSRQ